MTPDPAFRANTEGEGEVRGSVQPERGGGQRGEPLGTAVVLFAVAAFSAWANRRVLGMASPLQGGVFRLPGLGVSPTSGLRWDWHPSAT